MTCCQRNLIRVQRELDPGVIEEILNIRRRGLLRTEPTPIGK